MRVWLLSIHVLALLSAAVCQAQTFDAPGRSETLPTAEDDWVFIGTSLIDAGEDRFLGIVSLDGSGVIQTPIRPAPGGRVFVPETFRTRGNRGPRTDVVTVFDPATLAVADEVIIPSKRALMAPLDGATALTDDARYFAVYNLTPAQSISIVDTEALEFVGEIATPGCSLVFSAGNRRLFMICANGDLLDVELEANGTLQSRSRIQGFFDPQTDPLRENGVRFRNRWIFASFDGMAHVLDVSDDEIRFADSWSLLSRRDRRQNWRIAGDQHLAVHEQSGRLYALMRRSADALDDPADYDGQQIWVYDLQSRMRVDRFDAVASGSNAGGGGGLGGSTGDGASNIIVTQGANPLLVTVGSGFVSVRDALTGEYLHDTLRSAPQDGRLALARQQGAGNSR